MLSLSTSSMTIVAKLLSSLVVTPVTLILFNFNRGIIINNIQ